jgi:triacylglycerol esterase/lipase EstA (alpha/beta hydrolase family)
MGGVASREYVQGDDYNDVDKVITLDSPHEGTGALNLLNLEVC